VSLSLGPNVANPLRDPQDRRLPRMPEPCALVIFGVTGDLARKKLMPAIYDLANRGLLPPGFSLVGFARRDWENEDFAQVTHDSVKQYARTPFRDTVWEQLSEGVRFVPGEFTDDEAFDRLAETFSDLDRLGDAPVEKVRAALARAAGRPVTFGWGPRFLHSTGQYHKGGPANGSFLQITGAVTNDLPVPERPYTFGLLQAAQAAGDRLALSSRGRPLLWLHLTDRKAGAAQLVEAARALAEGS